MKAFYGASEPNYILKNAKTGNVIILDKDEKPVTYGARHFWKADLSFLDTLCDFNTATSKILAHVVKSTRPSTNEFFGTYKGIAKKLPCDAESVRKAFRLMQEKDILVCSDVDRCWMMNPRLLVKGDLLKKVRLMSQYDTLRGRKLGNVILSDTEGKDPVYLSADYPSENSVLQQREYFIKLYNGFFDVVSGLSKKEFSVLLFLLNRMNYSENMYIGTTEKIAINCNCSSATVSRAMRILTEKGLVAMLQQGCWLINPSLAIKGNANKEKMLMERFTEVQKDYRAKKNRRKNGKTAQEKENPKN